MFPVVMRTPSQVRYSEHAALELDSLFEKVRIMRSEASRLEEEKRHVQRLLGQLLHSSELIHCSETDRADLLARGDHIAHLLDTMQVHVEELREAGQLESYERVVEKVDALEQQVRNAEEAGENPPLETIRAYYNAASPEPTGRIDERFQSLVLGCSLGDQKSLRKRLAELAKEAEEVAARVAALSQEERDARRSRALAAKAAQGESHTDVEERGSETAEEGEASSVEAAPPAAAQNGVSQGPNGSASLQQPAAADVPMASSDANGTTPSILTAVQQPTPKPQKQKRAKQGGPPLAVKRENNHADASGVEQPYGNDGNIAQPGRRVIPVTSGTAQDGAAWSQADTVNSVADGRNGTIKASTAAASPAPNTHPRRAAAQPPQVPDTTTRFSSTMPARTQAPGARIGSPMDIDDGEDLLRGAPRPMARGDGNQPRRGGSDQLGAADNRIDPDMLMYSPLSASAKRPGKSSGRRHARETARGVPDDDNQPENTEALRRAMEASRQRRVPAGYQGYPQTAGGYGFPGYRLPSSYPPRADAYRFDDGYSFGGRGGWPFSVW